MAEVGKYNKLKVLRKAEQGLYLEGERENDILLPNAYIPENCEIGDEIEVFVYRDSEDRIIATNLIPLATVGEFAGLKVVASTKVGAFVDWGLAKDLLVPFKEQHESMITGRTYAVYVLLDEKTDRVIGTTKFNRFLSQERPDLVEGQEVDLIINRRTHLGPAKSNELVIILCRSSKLEDGSIAISLIVSSSIFKITLILYAMSVLNKFVQN